MNFAINDISKVLAPLQVLWKKVMPSPTGYETNYLKRKDAGKLFTINSISTSPCNKESKHLKLGASTTKRPLRVVRVLESDHSPANVGRMTISGRMADVCAELDRLADGEIAIH
jgi:hypothetical protein